MYMISIEANARRVVCTQAAYVHAYIGVGLEATSMTSKINLFEICKIFKLCRVPLRTI